MQQLLAHIARMEGYRPGEQPTDGNFTKLNTNENPYPPSPRVLDRLREAVADDLRLYPDAAAGGVRQRLAGLFGISIDQIMVGNGSDELLSIIMRSCVGPNDLVAYPQPTYSYYKKLIQIQNASEQAVEFKDDYSLPSELTDENAKVTLLANPNSPSGTLIDPETVKKLADKVAGILVVDEAYVDFCDGGSVDLVRDLPNLIVVRTLSKSFSLAGMRIGFAVAVRDLIEGMWKVKDHYNVNRLSLLAAEAALDDIDWMRGNAKRICDSRERLRGELDQLGFWVWPSSANFLLARRKSPSAGELYEALKRSGILVRFFDEPRLRDCLRISVGTESQNDALISELRKLL